jgi:hypothetical protein
MCALAENDHLLHTNLRLVRIPFRWSCLRLLDLQMAQHTIIFDMCNQHVGLLDIMKAETKLCATIGDEIGFDPAHQLLCAATHAEASIHA